MARRIRCFLTDDSGATAIEYALIGSVISMTIIIWAQSIGQSLNQTFDAVRVPFK